MALRPGLTLQPRQRLVLSPGVQTGLTLLRLPAAALDEAIDREIAENPFLRRAAPRADPVAMAGADPLAALAATPTLLERLHFQIGMMALPPRVRAVAEVLAGDLREDGYLDSDPAELADLLGGDAAVLAEGLAALQACDPPGIGARTLSECLALQLVDAGLSRDLAARVVADLPALAGADARVLARRLDLPRREAARIAGLLPQLRPRPLEPDLQAQAPLRPDLVLTRGPDGAVQVRLGLAGAPRLVLDRGLMRRAGSGAFVDACRDRARMLIASLRYRGQTLLRIGRHLAAHQARFLALGREHLRPLSRAQVAADLGLHPSTVGRAVAGKAVAVEGRLYPLEVFFAVPVPRADGGTVANTVVRQRIAAIIAAEDPEAPLSDEAIRARLGAEGIDIARRTVAKYREALRLPTSRQRRRPARVRATGAARQGP